MAQGVKLIQQQQHGFPTGGDLPAHQVRSVVLRGGDVAENDAIPVVEGRGQKSRRRLRARREKDGGDLVVAPPFEESVRVAIVNL